MATASRNLSKYDKDFVPNGADFKIGIVVSEWNESITGKLLKGAKDALIENGVHESNILVRWVPGAFELPLGAQFMCEYTVVCEGATQGIKDVNLKFNTPIAFCVLTDNNIQQSIDRSGGKHGNKGIECAIACLKMIDLKKNMGRSGQFGYSK